MIKRRLFRIHNVNQKLEMALGLLFHFPVIAGVALTAAGSSKLQAKEQPIEKAEQLVKAGMAILTVTWAILVGWTALSLTAPRAQNVKARAGTVVCSDVRVSPYLIGIFLLIDLKLLWSITFSLVFIGIRVFYSLATLTTQKPSLNPTTGSLPIRVLLAFLPELIATIAYVAAGLQTQGAAQLGDQDEGDDYSMPRKTQSAPWV